MKHSLFWFPLGKLLTALGGIPVNRNSAQGMVGDLAEQFVYMSKILNQTELYVGCSCAMDDGSMIVSQGFPPVEISIHADIWIKYMSCDLG
jgi:1-acyl-sn-glycerol-3-phosphate acyltransferase